MRRSVSILRKIGVIIVGVPIIILGVILIPLPGPGILVCVLGFFILSLEFEWADRYFQKMKVHLKKLTDAAKAKQRELQEKAEREEQRSKKK